MRQVPTNCSLYSMCVSLNLNTQRHYGIFVDVPMHTSNLHPLRLQQCARGNKGLVEQSLCAAHVHQSLAYTPEGSEPLSGPVVTVVTATAVAQKISKNIWGVIITDPHNVRSHMLPPNQQLDRASCSALCFPAHLAAVFKILFSM